ncbi:Aste57867_24471 [Aphanomyces stellatus]|uniref:Aste57867_24471 protein n=1 Tax=Aphanomyces stellatus TaxID=120398 RepID=A0A485LSE3_9STRA|nr:hypothetical protein As57867_024394 [Aphanomyces stellatus]VFU01110.1 Aste57867_24471 [Aphanomyces stellatus]
MVFVSFEGFLEALPHASTVDAAAPPPLGIVVTPGSPPKPVKNVSPVKVFDDSFVLYVSDKATRETYALPKTHSEIQAFHAAIRACIAAHPCAVFACCGPLRRLARSAAPRRRKLVVFRFEASDLGLDKHTVERTWNVEELVKDVLQATTDRDASCAAVDAARAVLDTFLQLSTHRHDKAQQTLAERLTTVTLALDCAICLSTASSTKQVRLACGHAFHASCLAQWMCTQWTCPVCRTPV